MQAKKILDEIFCRGIQKKLNRGFYMSVDMYLTIEKEATENNITRGVLLEKIIEIYYNNYKDDTVEILIISKDDVTKFFRISIKYDEMLESMLEYFKHKSKQKISKNNILLRACEYYFENEKYKLEKK